MAKSQQPAVVLFATALIGLGVLGLVYGDFAKGYQPVAAWFPGRTILAYAFGIVQLALGVGLLFRVTRTWAVRILFPYLILWALLKVPALFVAPQIEAVWLGIGELTMLLAGGWTLFARLGEIPESSWLRYLSGDRGVRFARILFGISVLPVGLAHLMYTPQTVELIPSYFPSRPFWAWLTGAGQMASGLGILFGVLPGIAAWAEVGQLILYTLLVWLPPTILHPDSRVNWTALFITWVICAAAWAVAQNIKTSAAAEPLPANPA